LLLQRLPHALLNLSHGRRKIYSVDLRNILGVQALTIWVTGIGNLDVQC
jgi:hypothetical protein